MTSKRHLSPEIAHYESARCNYFEKAECRSCSLLGNSPGTRLETKLQKLRDIFAQHSIPPSTLGEMSLPSHPWQSRRKIKMSVTGTSQHPILGIVRSDLSSVDLCDCPLTPLPIQELLHFLREAITSEDLPPYNIKTRDGELKHIVVVSNAAMSEAIVRFVLRDSRLIGALRQLETKIRERFPWVTVVSCNIQPIPAAILEGPSEVILTEQQLIQETLYDIPLYFNPQSFMQVTPEIAAKLYRAAQNVVREGDFRSALDLFCGVGGFSLHLAPYVDNVIGVELSEGAITSANRSAKESNLTNVRFIASDVEQFLDSDAFDRPDLIIVNPPRRGLSEGIIRHILRLRPERVIYSSCNPETLARDSKALSPTFIVEQARPFDMFPMTEHCEVLAVLRPSP